jgi:hypothetical protein
MSEPRINDEQLVSRVDIYRKPQNDTKVYGACP